MPRELMDVVVEYVSYVDKAANKQKFILTKSAEDNKELTRFEKPVTLVTKARDPQKLVYGIVYEPNVVDVQDDMMSEGAIEKAAHQFLADFRKIDQQHNFIEGAGVPVESYIMPGNLEINGHMITKGTWILVTKASDETWEKIQNGTYTGYSLAGYAKETRNVEKSKKTFVEMLKDFFGVATKEERDEAILTFNELTKVDEVVEPTVEEIVEPVAKEETIIEEVAKADTNTDTEEPVTTENEKIMLAKMEEINTNYEALLKSFAEKIEKIETENTKLREDLLKRTLPLATTVTKKEKSYGKADTLI